jgi:AcrR family transcriptional regulator
MLEAQYWREGTRWGMSTDEQSTSGRLPRGPHQLAPEEVVANQRRRLLDSLVWFVHVKGYLATSVADLIRRARISRRTFYELYPNREELLKAAFESCAASLLQEGNEARERAGGSRQLEELVRSVCLSARERPGTIALCTVEIAALGGAGFELREQLTSGYAQLIEDCLRAEGRALPAPLAITLASAVLRQVNARLSAGRAEELDELALQLARWIRSYRPVPAGLELAGAPARPWPWIGTDGLLGGRAPGTLTLAPDGRLRHIDRHARGLRTHVNRERILDAVAQLNSKHGYGALTIETIAAHADLPERVFRASFESKEESFASALELGHTKGQAIVARTRAGSGRWVEGVRDAIAALLEFLASEPCFTRLALVDAPLAGPVMARRANEYAATYARLLFDGAPQRRKPPPVAPEAIVNAVFELAYGHAALGRTGELPRSAAQAVYLALTPFLGAGEAAHTAAQPWPA